MRRGLLLLALLAGSPAAGDTDWLGTLDEARTVQSRNGAFRAELSGRADLEGYFLDQFPPGIIYWDHKWLANPRLALFLDGDDAGTKCLREFYARLRRRLYLREIHLDPGEQPDQLTEDRIRELLS